MAGTSDKPEARSLTFTNCQRCGGTHTDLVFLPLANAIDEWRWWSLCPATGQPVLASTPEDRPAPGIAALLKDYFALQKQIHDALGYREDWAVIPLDDRTASFWLVSQRESGGGFVVYSERPLTEETVRKGCVYSGTIYMQRFLPKWVYRTPTHTMVCVDTHIDGNKFLMVFDNAKECKDAALAGLYRDCWGEV